MPILAVLKIRVTTFFLTHAHENKRHGRSTVEDFNVARGVRYWQVFSLPCQHMCPSSPSTWQQHNVCKVRSKLLHLSILSSAIILSACRWSGACSTPSHVQCPNLLCLSATWPQLLYLTLVPPSPLDAQLQPPRRPRGCHL